MKLENKVAVLTAAASGIGLATSKLFAQEGAKVVIADIDVNAGESAAEEIRQSGGEATFVKTDVTSAEEIDGLFKQTVKLYGGFDVLFNGVGINMGKPVPECTEDDFDAVINFNLKSTFFGCKYAIPYFLKNDTGGVIVNNSSNGGVIGRPGDPLYVASKHAVSGLTKSLALAYAESNIRVNAVCPGPIATPLLFQNYDPETDREEYLKRAVSSCPTPRAASPEEVATAITFLACDDSSFVTGVALPVDGGKSAGVFNAHRYSMDFDLQM